MQTISLTQGQSAYLLVLAAIILAALFAFGLWLGLRLGRRSGRLEAEAGLPERLETERQDAVRRSRAVLAGQLAEQVAPYLPGFPFDPGDLRFIGKPVDFIAFVGAATGTVTEVAFVEVKSGKAGLNGAERSLRDAVKAGKVRWVEWRSP